MSWLPQRWRTQRNAIRHANCRIQWVIKTLNATCTSLWGVCLLECLFIPITYLLVVKDRLVRRSRRRLCCYLPTHPSASDDNYALGVSQEALSSLVFNKWKNDYRPFFRYFCFATKDRWKAWRHEKTHVFHFYEKRDCALSIGPPISQDYPLNLSI